MQIKVKYFGNIADICNCNEEYYENISEVDVLRKTLIDKYPALKDKIWVVAVNMEIIKENITLENDDEIALLPPFAGG